MCKRLTLLLLFDMHIENPTCYMSVRGSVNGGCSGHSLQCDRVFEYDSAHLHGRRPVSIHELYQTYHNEVWRHYSGSNIEICMWLILYDSLISYHVFFGKCNCIITVSFKYAENG